MNNHILRIKPYSEAEDYFVNTFIPICKDTVKCRLGNIFNKPYNYNELYERYSGIFNDKKGE